VASGQLHVVVGRPIKMSVDLLKLLILLGLMSSDKTIRRMRRRFTIIYNISNFIDERVKTTTDHKLSYNKTDTTIKATMYSAEIYKKINSVKRRLKV